MRYFVIVVLFLIVCDQSDKIRNLQSENADLKNKIELLKTPDHATKEIPTNPTNPTKKQRTGKIQSRPKRSDR